MSFGRDPFKEPDKEVKGVEPLLFVMLFLFLWLLLSYLTK